MIRKVTLLLLILLCVMSICGQLHAKHCDFCTNAGIDMPVSLAAGTVRTPEFTVKGKYYHIDLDAKWFIPSEELRCRMGFAASPSDNHCSLDPLLEIKWRVLDQDRVIAEGFDQGRTTHFEADSHSLTRNIGTFKGEDHHRYVVEVTFVKDASILNVTQPHLIVEPPGFSM